MHFSLERHGLSELEARLLRMWPVALSAAQSESRRVVVSRTWSRVSELRMQAIQLWHLRPQIEGHDPNKGRP